MKYQTQKSNGGQSGINKISIEFDDTDKCQ